MLEPFVSSDEKCISAKVFSSHNIQNWRCARGRSGVNCYKRFLAIGRFTCQSAADGDPP